MPTYERKCRDCSYEWEQDETMEGRFKDSSDVIGGYQHDPECPLDMADVCPMCGGYASRQIGRTSFVLKGSGWAKDGYSK